MDDDRQGRAPESAEDAAANKAAGRGVAQHWWGDRWLRALTLWIDGARLAEGRDAVRAGRVSDLRLAPGLVIAWVQDAGPRLCHVRVEIATFTEEEWEGILKALGARALYAAQLLSGELPRNIDAVLTSGSTLADRRSLFPSEGADIHAVCSCDEHKPCKHIASVLVLIGEMLDRDPFLLLTLRGRTKEEVLEALRERRLHVETDHDAQANAGHGGYASSAEGRPLGERVEDFWEIGPEAEEIHVRVAPAEVELEVLRILGELELEADQSLLERLERVYKAVSQRAMEIAFGDERLRDDRED
jgi:uncharacterized Zn finger protein